MTEQEKIIEMEQIDAFLKKELSGKELEQFLKRMEDDAELSNRVESYQAITMAIREQSILDQLGKLEDDFSNSGEENLENVRRFPRNLWIWSSIAASIILLVLFINKDKLFAPASDKLFDKYIYMESIPTGVLRGEEKQIETEEDSMYQRILEFYNYNDFKQVRTLAYQALEYTPFKEKYQNKAWLIIGVSWLEQKPPDPAKAQESLIMITGSDSSLTSVTNWYQALSLILSDDYEQAISLLNTLSLDPVYGKTSQELLSDLD